jgi:tRNA threonylcarbamoyladenosine biosynthesis protein TsaE
MFANMDFKVNLLADLPEVASRLLSAFPQHRIFFFFGQMGAGKTTFIQTLCTELGVVDSVSSPTYSIVNEYQCPAGKVYHFDFYRLKNESEALDMGYEEYFYDGDYCLVEWPEKIESLWPTEFVKVGITVINEQERLITAEAINLKG